MSIKDKIAPELKLAMLESIKKTEKSGNEHGFFMCIDKNKQLKLEKLPDGKLSASKTKCEGDTCGILLDIFPELCPEKKIQGLFHVHPQRLSTETRLGRKLTEKDIKNMVIVDKKGNIITLQTPSHQDILLALLTKCEKSTDGTVCTASDIDPDKVECWTPKKGAANLVTCYYAKRDNTLTKEKDIGPKMWIKPLFDKEIINL